MHQIRRLIIFLTIFSILAAACGSDVDLGEEVEELEQETEEIEDRLEEEVQEKEDELEQLVDDDDAEESSAPATAIDPFDQLLPIEGTENLRDIGGYQATDGRTVRRDLLYRSDTLANVVDPSQLTDLDLITIVDFRTEEEITEGPDNLPEGTSIKKANFPIGNPEDLGELLPPEKLQGQTIDELRTELTDLFVAGDFDAIDARLAELDIDIAQSRRDRYVGFVSEFSPAMASFMAEVQAAEGSPLLFHCEGGKDRTGAAAALLLLTLGVPRDTVIEDYLATNVVTADAIAEQQAASPESLFSIIGAHEDQIVAALDYIDDNYDSFDDYRRDVLDITDEEASALQDLLLE